LTKPLAIDLFIQAIKNNEFVHAHELLEEDWKRYKKTNQKIHAKALQGLINGATALALLYIKKRPHAYVKIWKVFQKYKILILEITLDNQDKFIEASELLEKKNIRFTQHKNY